MFVGSAIVAAGGGAIWGISWGVEQYYAGEAEKGGGISFLNNPNPPVDKMGKIKINDSSCGPGKVTGGGKGAFDNACWWKKGTAVGIVTTSVGVAAMLVTGYLALRHDSESPPASNTVGHRTRKPPVVITPVVQANGGGVRIDW
jgi:hypothetical protein